MKKAFLTFLFVLLIVIAATASHDEVYNDPLRPPNFPENPPPLSYSASSKPAAKLKITESSKPFSVSYGLAKGWNIISFPFSRVLETSGFKYKILRYGDGAYYPIDPAKDASQINTRWGYIAYSDSDSKAHATGLTSCGEIHSVSFDCGWNLIGCPSLNPVPWNRLAATVGSTTHPVLSIIGAPDSKKNYWISSKAFSFNKKLILTSLTEASNIRSPGKGFWIYSWHPVTITIMQEEKNIIYPSIKSVKPSTVQPGQSVAVEGRGFGNTQDMLCVSGVPVANNYLKSWSPGKIVFTVPSYAMSGDIVVYNDSKPSNPEKLNITDESLTMKGGTLKGNVQDINKNIISEAFVTLGNGLSTYTEDNGTFVISRIPKGEQTIKVSRVGHKSSCGKISIPENGLKSVLITLPWADKPVSDYQTSDNGKTDKEKPQIEKGTLYAVASAGTVDDKRWSVYRIDVSEWGNLNYSWKNIWYSDYGDTYYELKCPGARIGKTYNFKIEWRRKADGKSYTNTWSRKMYKDDQRENFDRPW